MTVRILSTLVGKQIVVNLRGGQFFRGRLVAIDGNEALEIEDEPLTHHINMSAVDVVSASNEQS